MSRRLRGAIRRGTRLGTGGRDDRGAATIFVVGLAIMLLVVAGLVVDGGLAINARSTAADIAEQAARSGATEVNIDALRDTGQVQIDQGLANARINDFLDQALQDNGNRNITYQGNEVTVTISERRVPTALLGLIGIQEFTVGAAATARAAVGIENEIP